MHYKILALAAIATTAFADINTLNSLKDIRQANLEYNKTLANWDGGILGSVSMLLASNKLINTLKDAHTHASSVSQESITPEQDAAHENEAFDIAHNLVKEVGSTVDTSIALKPKIEAMSLVGKAGKPVALKIAQKLRAAASNLGDVFGPTASNHRLAEIRTIVKQIDDHFDRTVSAYQ